MVIETTIAEKMVLNRFFKCQIMNIDTLLVKSFGLIKKKEFNTFIPQGYDMKLK